MENNGWEIIPELCTGCLRCELACSQLYEDSFCPSRARIEIVARGSTYEIRLKEECTGCGVCWESCFYGAIRAREAEK